MNLAQHLSDFETLTLSNDIKALKATKSNLEALELGRAIEIASENIFSVDNIADNGASNFDSVMLNLKGKSKSYIALVEAISGFELSSYGRGYYTICYQYKGQGLRRTTQAEMTAQELRDKGFDACVRYVTD
ncbi:hypothetical protein [Ornithobacterium rhinotracheale]|uniref:hypothetical protein n=1 Tax=Ornithobacterium rhinotracheale TaxID=28251 RepID=UPI00403604A9